MSVLLDHKDLLSTYTQLCQQLNLDQSGREKAWTLYLEVQKRERLPAMAEPLHWLVCALYLVCSQARVECISGEEMQGSGVSLVQVNKATLCQIVSFVTIPILYQIGTLLCHLFKLLPQLNTFDNTHCLTTQTLTLY